MENYRKFPKMFGKKKSLEWGNGRRADRARHSWKRIMVKVTRLLHRATQRSHGEPRVLFFVYLCVFSAHLCVTVRLLP